MMGRREGVKTSLAGISLLFLFYIAQAQVTETFSDGNIHTNPSWMGDTARFEVNSSGQLHLKGSGTDSAAIATSNYLIDSTEWMFWVRMSFSPSANNLARIYLVADQADLKGPLNGFFLQLGEAGSADAPELFRQQGLQTFPVCRGKPGSVANSFTSRFKINRTAAGVWTLFADTTGNSLFTYQASGTDASPITPAWFGLYCKYTSSNATKFYFDDIIIRPVLQDLTPPSLVGVTASSFQSIRLYFDEPIDPASLADLSLFGIDPAGPAVLAATSSASKPEVVTLSLGSPLQEEVPYVLWTVGLKDLAGNLLPPSSLPFTYYRPHTHDVVIHEIMADPTPQVGLPPFEYLELRNRTNRELVLEGWKLIIGSSVKSLPACLLPPLGYLILADSNARVFLSAYGNFIGFPSFSLSNEGTVVILENEAGQVIHTIAYEDDWYGESLKSEGGWSMEMVDANNPCGGKENWTASKASRGGSPGNLNSVSDTLPDATFPFPDRVGVSDPSWLRVYFSETVDSNCIRQAERFLIQPYGENPVFVIPVKPAYTSLDLMLPHPMQEGEVYTLVCTDTLRDCAGNITLPGISIGFGLPRPALPGDVVINEFLFDPDADAPEFLEIHNPSEKILDLTTLLLAETDEATLAPFTKYIVSEKSRLLFPGEYLALTSDPASLLLRYPATPPQRVLKLPSFPALGNVGGCFSILSYQDENLDPAAYSPDMHYPLLAKTKGVSLERMHPSLDGMDPAHWHSASSGCGYATPAARNSQWTGLEIQDEDISLMPPVFSPDNDGYQDVLSITTRMASPGFLANIMIFTSTGQNIRTLTRQYLLGTEDVFFWDGKDQQGYIMPPGIYILLFEFFNTTGTVKHIKKAAVLGSRL